MTVKFEPRIKLNQNILDYYTNVTSKSKLNINLFIPHSLVFKKSLNFFH